LKLNLLFIFMDMFTLLAYPILFIYSKINSFSNSKGDVALANILVPIPIAADE